MTKGMYGKKDIRRDGLLKAKKLAERENANVCKPRKGMYVAIGYDLFPYMTVHEIHKVRATHFMATFYHELPMHKDHPYVLMSRKQGQELIAKLDILKAERRDAISVVERKAHLVLKSALRTLNIKHPKKGFK